MLTILASLRSRLPEHQLRCICTNPDAVAARYGIEAIAITTRKARLWDRNTRMPRRVATTVRAAAAEALQYARAFWQLKRSDMLIVPGTGLVTDAYGLGHWGPYNMFKWVLMAKVRRARVLFISVGAGPIDRTLGRALVKAAMSLADYRSYRDDASRDCLRGIGLRVNGDRVYPDLVFSMPEVASLHEHAYTEGGRRVVGLGLMGYVGMYCAADPLPETYNAYLASLASFATWLLANDYDIRLLLGDGDTIAVDEFRSFLRARLGSYDEHRVIAEPIGSVQDVLAELSATDVVVATRFHNVLLALLVNKPVIALSFHHKCSCLMDQMKLSEYCHQIRPH